MFIQTGMEKILSCRMDGGIGMARKSRKNRNVESNIQTVVKKENLLDTAAYIRLSVENGGNETDETLVVQQMLVERFIEEHPDLRLEEVYIDNGFTGTNFERPGFMRLMEDVRSGKVQCIVVKDLSRFGRDYLETGYYLETILPKLNVRFIAITDDYDSSRKEDRENISVPIKNMVNAMYAKDMSKKILAAKEAQKRNGNITLSKVAFGYVRSEDKTRQVVDETVASVVRMIFQWTLLGVNKREIADRLNLLGVATPGQKEKRKIARVPLEETKWNGGTVRKILENPTYTGDIVTGKLKQSLYKGVKQYHTEPEEWDVQKDMHTPLVARDDYEELQESREEIHKVTKKRQSRYTKDREKYQDSFLGMVRCGECGNVMYFRRYTHNYTTNEKMGSDYYCGNKQCSRNLIEENLLKILVMDQIQILIKSMCDRKLLLQKMKSATKENNIFYKAAAKVRTLERKITQTEERNTRLYSLKRILRILDSVQRESEEKYTDNSFTGKRQQRVLESELEKLKNERIHQYEAYAEGVLSREKYITVKKQLTETIEKIQSEQKALASVIIEEERYRSRIRTAVQQLEVQIERGKLTKEIIDTMIDTVYVYDKKRIEVILRFDDVLQKVISEYMEGAKGA